ncbi:hypothetical protein BDP27DRAFT_1311408 [Rhodocollybia butyracea]|uniref:Uncharacterized protein n=1 Tax=Rhodocollybia butyracea TaxID=206335 RepID=A0A9P5Q9Q2_9AGAR|nr:hypothetical protein BDP27DRAFT_1311408 [Rhodocollybia butyracea]
MLVDGKLGPTMDISAFCTVHELSLDIASRLTKNGFQNTKAFRYVTLNDLKEMLFKHGEIASLRVAVSEWSEGSQQ